MARYNKKDYPLKQIIRIILKRLWIIILCAIIGAVGTFVVSKYVIEEEYTVSVSMYATPNIKAESIGESLNYLYYTQQIVDTYVRILKTNSFLKQVADASNLKYSPEDLKKMIEIEKVDETQILQIKVSSNSPGDSYKLAIIASELAPQKILDMKTATSVSVVDEAIMPQNASSPNILINTIIGLVLGIAIGYLIINVLEIFDIRIEDEEDFKDNYNLPILGIIPKIKEE